MKKLLSGLLAVVLVLSMTVFALAAGTVELSIQATDGTSSVSVTKGDTFEVNLVLSSSDSSSKLELYSFQDYVDFDTAMLSYEGYTGKLDTGDNGINVSLTSLSGQADRVLVTRVSLTKYSPADNPTTIVTLKFKALQSGTTTLEHWRPILTAESNDPDNIQTQKVTTNNMTVNITNSTTPAGTGGTGGGGAGGAGDNSGGGSGDDNSTPSTTTDPTDKTVPFIDVPSDAYYADAVKWAVDNGITTGTDSTHFSPFDITTRAQMVTFLWRASGSPEPRSNVNPFVDMDTSDYYYKAVLWGYENVYVKGTSPTTFDGELTVTRGQAMAFLARLAGVADEATGYRHNFTDVDSAAYYNNAISWAAANGIAKGVSSTTFAPNTGCKRGEVVTFLYRYFVK